LVKTEFLVFLVDLQLFLLELDLLVFHFLQNLDKLVLLSSVPDQEISFYFPDLLLVLFDFLSNERHFMMNFLRELLNLVEKHFQFSVWEFFVADIELGPERGRWRRLEIWWVVSLLDRVVRVRVDLKLGSWLVYWSWVRVFVVIERVVISGVVEGLPEVGFLFGTGLFVMVRGVLIKVSEFLLNLWIVKFIHRLLSFAIVRDRLRQGYLSLFVIIQVLRILAIIAMKRYVSMIRVQLFFIVKVIEPIRVGRLITSEWYGTLILLLAFETSWFKVVAVFHLLERTARLLYATANWVWQA
jgi:hypothetical protein